MKSKSALASAEKIIKRKPAVKQLMLSKPIKHIDITSFDARVILSQMTDMSFTSRDLAKAAEIYNMMLSDKKCSIILTIAGSTSAGGCMKLYADLVKNNMVDAIVATGAAIIDMDFFLKHLASSIIKAANLQTINSYALIILIVFMILI